LIRCVKKGGGYGIAEKRGRWTHEGKHKPKKKVVQKEERQVNGGRKRKW